MRPSTRPNPPHLPAAAATTRRRIIHSPALIEFLLHLVKKGILSRSFGGLKIFFPFRRKFSHVAEEHDRNNSRSFSSPVIL